MKQSRAIRNNNPLNIRKGSKWQGMAPVQFDDSFTVFSSTQAGFRAALIIIRNYISGRNSTGLIIDTIETIIRRWAPPQENATEAYIRFVCQTTDIPRSQKLRFEDRQNICSIVHSMAFVESGVWFPLSDIRAAYDLL